MDEQEPKPPVEPNKNPIGRPSKYTPEMCDRLVQLMSQGFSIEASAGSLGVSKDTIYEWVKIYPDFSDAKKLGEAMSQHFWENLGIEHILNKSDSIPFGPSSSRSLNASIWIFNMKNRFSWRDKTEISTDKEKPLSITLNYDRSKKRTNKE